MHLLDLPEELLIAILLHLPPRALVARVSLACRRLYLLLQSDVFWRRRYALQVCTPLPPVKSLSNSWRHWQRASVQGEFARLFSGGETTMHVTTLKGPTGVVDCVHMMYPPLSGSVGLVAAGCRDSFLYVWRRRRREGAGGGGEGRSMRSDTINKLYGHKGWVWCLTSDPARPELLCSGGWDNTVRVWDTTVGMEVTCVKDHKAAVLALDFPEPSCLVTSSYDRAVREFDLRIPISLLAEHRTHRKPVLALASTEGYVYSGGEDRHLCVWDRRARKILQTIKLNSLVSSLHYDHGLLSCAVQSTVSIYDCSKGTLTKTSSLSPQHSFHSSLTSVSHTQGMVVTGSKDGSVAIHGPSPNHTHITTLLRETGKGSHNVTSLDCSLNTLTIATSNCTVDMWTPRYSVWDFLS